MGDRYNRGTDRTRQLLGTLLVAWTFVTGCALALGSAIYYQTNDLKVLIAWFGAPLLVGTALLIVVAFTTLVSAGARVPQGEPPEGLRRRKDIHGRK